MVGIMLESDPLRLLSYAFLYTAPALYILRDIEKAPHTKTSISFFFASYSLVVFVKLIKVKAVLA